jgi:class 3 adenylate cyclase/tetratricopeptide (TPR) repeat protein
MKCPKCQFENPEGFEFCGKCAQRLEELPELEEAVPSTASERKYVTVLFSDLSDYTALSEKLDPEEVKEITSQLFGQISEVIAKYDGLVEKFIGDAVVALFGVPRGYEDDPVRAIRAAREIHELADAESPDLEKRFGHHLAMHTGINTGLVVTGQVDVERGTHGVAGDTINLASRLQGLANAGEILVGWDTYRQSEGYFNFEELEPTKVKGKKEPVRIYRVLSPKEEPSKIHRLRGLRAELIGRKVELAKLEEAVNNLRKGKSAIFSISGDAGTGKSRLVEEFKATLDSKEIQWLEGHAYSYSKNIPYFPLIDFLNRVLQIEEGDPPAKLREKFESGIRNLVGKREDIIPYIGILYALDYPEIESVSPEFWKFRVTEGIQEVLSALAKKTPTIFCLEDLHWADPSFIELLRNIAVKVSEPAIVLCVYRPEFSLFKSSQLNEIGRIYREIRLTDLSPSDSEHMLESLLKTETIPSDLRRLVQDRAEGNPFYLEELVNSLIESETLIRDNGSWKVTRALTESEISSTIHGVIIGRLDRLEKGRKKILQEASVIGRSFLYEILKRITELKQDIDDALRGLEQLDLIRTRSLQPDLEYMFKHAVTQEVVYNGLLKKERSDIHERIGLIMEQLLKDRLTEFYETLAFHFKQGQSVHKAVDYLMKSGEKSLKRYAVEESHQYYKEAFELLDSKAEKTKVEKELLIELLIEWAYVFYYRGDFKGMAEVFSANRAIAESLQDKSQLGMFHAWYGWTITCQNKITEGYRWLKKALQIGKENKDQRVIGYACAWLTWVCSFMGKPEQAIKNGERAQEISKAFEADAYLYFKSLAGLGFANWILGDGKKATEIGNTLMEYGKKHSNIRSLSMGYACIGCGWSIIGDLATAIESFENAINVGGEPFYTEVIRMNLALLFIRNGQITEAENALNRVVTFSRDLAAGVAGVPAEVFLGVILIAKSQMSLGLKRLRDGNQKLLMSGNILYYLQCEYTLGMVFSQIAIGAEPISLSKIFKNVGFLVKNVPFASKKAEGHFKEVIRVAGEMRAKPILGGVYLDLGLLHKAKKRTDKAKECISEAIKIFEQCEAVILLKHAKEALASLESSS